MSFVGWPWHNLWFASLIRPASDAVLEALMSDKLREGIGGFSARKNNHQLLEEEVNFDRGLHPWVYPSFRIWSTPIFLRSPHLLYKSLFCSLCVLLHTDFLVFSLYHSQVFHSAFFSFTHQFFSSDSLPLSLSLSPVLASSLGLPYFLSLACSLCLLLICLYHIPKVSFVFIFCVVHLLLAQQ